MLRRLSAATEERRIPREHDPLQGEGFHQERGRGRTEPADSLRLLEEGVPELLPATAPADRFYARGDYEAAREEYERVVRSHSGKPLAGEALFKAGLCSIQEGRFAEARERFFAVAQTAAVRLTSGFLK